MFEELKEVYRRNNRLVELDRLLLTAVYKSPIEDNEFLPEDIKWLDEENSAEVDKFIECLLQLSEYYSDKNKVFSAALWGNWNAISYLRRQRSFLSVIFDSEKIRKKQFIHYRGLIATAAVHFADGKVRTSITSNALTDIQSYEEKVSRAIDILNS